MYAHAFLRTRTFVGTPLISFVDLFVYLCSSLTYCLMCPAAMWSPTGKGLNSMRFCIDVFLCFCRLPIKCPGSGVVPDLAIPDLCLLPSFFLLTRVPLARNTVYCAILSEQILVGCPLGMLGVPISY